MFSVDRCFENKYIYNMPIFSYQIKLYLPECHSLKEKRGVLMRFRSTIQNKFQISSAELDFQDKWQSSLIGMVWVTSDLKVGQKMFEDIKKFINTEFPFVFMEHEEFEIL
jgi:hypothetical protein